MSRPGVGIADLHSHLVPGVDDGSRTIEESMEGVGRLWAIGVRRIVTTPHFRGSLTHDRGAQAGRMEELDRGWKELSAAVQTAFPDLVLERGCEVMLDIPDPDLSHPGIRLGSTDYVLVEWPHLTVPPGTLRVLQRICGSEVYPVIAHPERYTGFDRELTLAGEWRAAGALLQVNYGSLLGQYGDPPRAHAFSLLERGWVDLFSTDFHGRRTQPLFLAEVQRVFLELGFPELFDLLARVNPGRILSGERPVEVPPLQRRKRWRERLLDLIRGSYWE